MNSQSSSRILNAVLGLFCIFILWSVVHAATPNPGHPWTEVGDGTFQVTGPTSLRTYTLPDTNASILTNYNLNQGDLLYADAASSSARLPKDTNATRYLSNTGTNNNPLWALINLANGVTGILTSVNGGTGNGFTKFTGPTTSEKTFTLPDASASVLTSAAAVTVGQGGTGLSSLTSNGVLIGNAGSNPTFVTNTVEGQVLTASSSGAWLADYPSITASPRRLMAFYKNAGAATFTTVGTAAILTVSATSSSADDSFGAFENAATGLAANSVSGVITSNFTQVRRAWEIEYYTVIKTDPTAITSLRYWVGFFGANPDSTSTTTTNMIAFRYATDADGTSFWRAVTCVTTCATAPSITTTSVAIAANTLYKLRIVCRNVVPDCKFYINDVLAATQTVSLPAASSLLGWGNRVTTLSGAVRNIKTSRINVAHNY